jgi:hypothetical protein
MKFVAHLFSQDGILTATVDSSTYLVNKSHVNYNGLIRAFKDNNADEFVRLYNVSTAINKAFDGSGVKVVNDQVYYNGEVVDHSVATRILQLIKEDQPVQYLINFLDKLFQNISWNSRQQGFRFLEHKNLPICPDGDFLAYKTVSSDYLDKFSGTISNHVGAVIDWRHKRHLISDDPSSHCSQGLHVGALSYAGPGGWYNNVNDKVVIVKVNPADMVSVPNDHSYQKMRVCRYEVIADYVAPLTHSVYSAQPDDWKYDEFEDEDDEECDDFFDDSVDLYELIYGDHIEFDYTNSEGVTEKRSLQVDEVDQIDGTVTGTLLPGDVSYKNVRDDQWRKFKEDYISNLRLVLN